MRSLPQTVCCHSHFISPKYISVPSLIVRGPRINKLKAQTKFTSFYCLGLLVVVLVISVSMNSHHGTSVYQISLLEDPP